MSYSFGSPKPDASGFSFGGAGDAKTGAVKPFSFGTPTASAPTFNLSGYGTPATAPQPAATAPAPGGFSLGGTPAALNLNAVATTNTSTLAGFNMTASSGGATAQPIHSAGGFGFGGATIGTSSSAGLTLGSTATPSIGATAPGLNLTATIGPTNASTGGFGLLGTPKTTAVLAGAAAAPIASLNLSAATPTPSFSLPSATAAPTGLSFPIGGATKTTTGVSTGFPLPTSVSTSTSSTALPTAIPATGNLTFVQLDDAINKWTIDLEEQGKLFSNQAKQLNAWDRLLVSNGEKVLALNSGIERVKQQQQQLDQELDFVLAQEKELEDLITPLEKELNDIPLTDVDRLHTYQLAENMDTQLKQMSEDLKEIIEQLNESNKNQENCNPITQIRKILNAHMDSLQWIDRQTSKITGHLDQISKMHDQRRKTHEHSLKKTYD